MNHDEALKAIYTSPATGGGGADKLYLAARKQGVQTTLAKVKAWLQTHKTYQNNAPNPRDKKENWFKITDKPNSWVADSVFLRQYAKVPGNGGYVGFLLFMELTTRQVYARPFKTSHVYDTGSADDDIQIVDDKDVKGIFEIVKEFVAWTINPDPGHKIPDPNNPNALIAIRHPISTFSSDNGKEFDNKLVKNLFATKGIEQRFHRKEDHRANGLLNNAVRILRRNLFDHWSHEGNTVGLWVPHLQDAVKNWNTHYNRDVKASPDDLKDDPDSQDQIRQAARAWNKDVWNRTALAGNATVLRYLRRNTEDKGLFAKEGRNWSEPYTLGARSTQRAPSSYSYQLLDHAGNKYKDGRSYRPYELKTVLGRTVEPPKVDKMEAIAKENRVERRLKQAGVAQEAVVKEPRAVRAPTRLEEEEEQQPEQQQKQDSVPERILDYDWGETQQRAVKGGVEEWQPLRFLVKWKPTPEFIKHWSKYQSLFQTWDVSAKNYVSWQPNDKDWNSGKTVQTILSPNSIYNRQLVLDFITAAKLSKKDKLDVGAEYYISAAPKGGFKLNP